MVNYEIPFGVEHFRGLRADKLAYIDQSHLIATLIDRPGARVVCLERPPGFGKSLSLSLLRCFFESNPDDLSEIFQDLAIWQAGDRYRAHFQRYPVIYLNLGDLVYPSADELRWALRASLRELADEHRSVLQSAASSPLDRERLSNILADNASDAAYWRLPRDLTRALHRVYGERALLLIDDYDRPLVAGLAHGYARAAMHLIRPMLTTALSHNEHLARAVVTRTVPIIDRDTRTGLERAVLSSPLQLNLGPGGSGGLTESALTALLEHHQRSDRLEELTRWYGGHRVGTESAYHPAHIMHFLLDPNARIGPRSSAGSLQSVVRQCIDRNLDHYRTDLTRLLAGDATEAELAPQISLDELTARPAPLWHLLISIGWVHPEPLPRAGTGLDAYALTIPNRNARSLLADAIPPERPRRPPTATRPRQTPLESVESVAPISQVSSRDSALLSSLPHNSTKPSSRLPTLAKQFGHSSAGQPNPAADPAHIQPGLRRPGRPDLEIDADAFETELRQFFHDLRENNDAEHNDAEHNDAEHNDAEHNDAEHDQAGPNQDKPSPAELRNDRTAVERDHSEGRRDQDKHDAAIAATVTLKTAPSKDATS